MTPQTDLSPEDRAELELCERLHRESREEDARYRRTLRGFVRRRLWITRRVLAELRYQLGAWRHVMLTGHDVFDDSGVWECNTCGKQL
jgi:hypothetical protein